MEFLMIGGIAVALFVVVLIADRLMTKAEKEAEVKPQEPAPKKPKRARNAKGHFKADDPSTPNVNEAWEGGKAPKPKKKKATRKKKAVKKTK